MILSYSQIRMYTECHLKYKFHYIDKIRSTNMHGALLFGGSIDRALNHLLETRNLEESINMFEKSFRFQTINKVNTYLPTATNVVFSKNDFDEDLLLTEDKVKIDKFIQEKTQLNRNNNLDLYYTIVEKKQSVGFKNLSTEEKQVYNIFNWFSLKNKGIIMLRSYDKKVMPRIKSVLSVQKTMMLDNGVGDQVKAILDLVIEWEDGKRYIMDNKTSSIKYEKDSAMKSPQLMGYYHTAKNEFKIDGGVGYFVLSKQILKNKEKICSQCKFNGSGTRYKTCNNEVPVNLTGGQTDRCNGEWLETINPECYIDIILNQVTPSVEKLVLHTYDEATNGIKSGMFGPNLNSCGNENFRCQYYSKCYFNDSSELVDLSKPNEDK